MCKNGQWGGIHLLSFQIYLRKYDSDIFSACFPWCRRRVGAALLLSMLCLSRSIQSVNPIKINPVNSAGLATKKRDIVVRPDFELDKFIRILANQKLI